jgi:hypothetical protein
MVILAITIIVMTDYFVERIDHAPSHVIRKQLRVGLFGIARIVHGQMMHVHVIPGLRHETPNVKDDIAATAKGWIVSMSRGKWHVNDDRLDRLSSSKGARVKVNHDMTRRRRAFGTNRHWRPLSDG